MAVGAVLSLAVLAALGRLDSHAGLEATLGVIAVQVIPLSLGAMIANLVFSPDADRAHGSDGDELGSPVSELLNDVGATFAGAIFIGFAVAPTEEIPMLAASLNIWNLTALLALSLLAGYLIVFASGFDPSHHGAHRGGLFQRPISETVLAYVVSLVAALVMLVGFGQLSLDDPALAVVTKVLVLAVPASIGGAAGRVVV
jgi:putative integral membrane protein (TIGR02587 family)